MQQPCTNRLSDAITCKMTAQTKRLSLKSSVNEATHTSHMMPVPREGFICFIKTLISESTTQHTHTAVKLTQGKTHEHTQLMVSGQLSLSEQECPLDTDRQNLAYGY